jgi:hypothetical protein
MFRILCLLAIIILLTVTPAFAQGELAYGQMISGVIDDNAFFNAWTFYASANDDIEATMVASDGLQPLLGLLDPSGELVARSDDGEIDGSVRIDYTIPREGTFTLIATRVGNEEGTSTGSYSLSLRLAARVGMPLDAREVSFRCDEFEAVTALKVELQPELATPGVPYRFSVYSLDGFQGIVRLRGTELDFELCQRGNIDNLGDILYLPGEQPLLIDESMLADQFDLSLQDPQINGTLTLTVGSVDGAPGRYLVVIQGLAIDEANTEDTVIAEVGARAASAPVLAYAVADDNRNSRLDPHLQLAGEPNGCDDAGRRGCESVPSFAGSGLRIVDDLTLLGDRFDAGLLLRAETTDRQELEIGSFSGNTFGAYALFFIGALPPIE